MLDTINFKFLPNTWHKYVLIIGYTTPGETQTLSPHMYPSALTLGHMYADKSLDMSSDFRPSVKALLDVSRKCQRVPAVT